MGRQQQQAPAGKQVQARRKVAGPNTKRGMQKRIKKTHRAHKSRYKMSKPGLKVYMEKLKDKEVPKKRRVALQEVNASGAGPALGSRKKNGRPRTRGQSAERP